MPSKKPPYSPQRARLGRNIASLRLKVGLTQESLAEKIGVSTRYFQAIESGENFPSLSKLGVLKRELGVDWNTLLDGCDVE